MIIYSVGEIESNTTDGDFTMKHKTTTNQSHCRKNDVKLVVMVFILASLLTLHAKLVCIFLQNNLEEYHTRRIKRLDQDPPKQFCLDYKGYQQVEKVARESEKSSLYKCLGSRV